jgi:putative inorganic carbon (HCO3(-)) transporter
VTRAETSRGQGTAGSETGEAQEGVLPGAFAGLFGVFLGLALLKFGNPVILEKQIHWPEGLLTWMIASWPVVVGHWLLAGVLVMGLMVARWRVDAPRWLVALPLAWLIWEALAATQTVNAALTRATLAHFATCVVCFYLGLFALGRVCRLGLFWAGLLAGFALVLVSGFEQHFGGLAETRRYVYLYNPDGAGVPKEFLERLQSNRIFATLLYPNALAGVILMLLPVALAVIGSLKTQFTRGARWFSMALAGGAALACLYWSGSKGGWLLILLTGLVAALFLPVKRRFKLVLVGTALALGLAGFFVKYSAYFKKGAPSVGARFDYWTAAGQIIADRPVFGTGPGTFAVAYAKVKKPEWEMARLTHNDYLEQASDSGLPGMVLYTALIVGTLVFAMRRNNGDWVRRAVWLGLLGWALQSLMEFGLYIPAVAWPAFAFMGWLLGRGSNPSTVGPPAANMGTSR